MTRCSTSSPSLASSVGCSATVAVVGRIAGPRRHLADSIGLSSSAAKRSRRPGSSLFFPRAARRHRKVQRGRMRGALRRLRVAIVVIDHDNVHPRLRQGRCSMSRRHCAHGCQKSPVGCNCVRLRGVVDHVDEWHTAVNCLHPSGESAHVAESAEHPEAHKRASHTVATVKRATHNIQKASQTATGYSQCHRPKIQTKISLALGQRDKHSLSSLRFLVLCCFLLSCSSAFKVNVDNILPVLLTGPGGYFIELVC